MNIKYHALTSAAVTVALDGNGWMFLLGLAPDFTLIYNEFKIRIQGKPFDPTLVDPATLVCYRLAHSLFVSLTLWLCFDWRFACAHLMHIIPDWFTHTGTFAARPFYPIANWAIEGREVLK